MDDLKQFVASNPQVSASMITALFGILGIFINIFINFWFRKNDYKNKNRMQQIVNLESYYLPLFDKIINLQNCIQNFSAEDLDLYIILDGKIEASYASKIKRLKEILLDLFNFCSEERYKFLDNCKLFEIHRKVRMMIIDLNQFMENNIKMTDKRMISETLVEIEELTYRIKQYEIFLAKNNNILKYIKYFNNWSSYKKNRNISQKI